MNFKYFKNVVASLAAVSLSALLFTACADPVPDDYTEEVVVEGFAISGRPLNNIKIYRSIPLSDTFKLDNAIITDAQIFVSENGTAVPMEFIADSLGGRYQAADTSFRVKPNSTYTLNVSARGKVLTGTAYTPNDFSWLKKPADTLLYPGLKNEIKIYDSLNISWTPTPSASRYVIAMECIDTIRYGVYLQPPTADSNRRIREKEQFESGSLIASERTRFGFALVSNTPTVWLAFKWFGAHRLHIYSGDKSFSDWFSLVGFGRASQYDYRRGSITGGLGVWAGATPITADIFLVKDKP